MRNGNWLRGVPTRTLNGEGGQTKAGEVLERFKVSEWKPENQRPVERELARRAKRRGKK